MGDLAGSEQRAGGTAPRLPSSFVRPRPSPRSGGVAAGSQLNTWQLMPAFLSARLHPALQLPGLVPPYLYSVHTAPAHPPVFLPFLSVDERGGFVPVLPYFSPPSMVFFFSRFSNESLDDSLSLSCSSRSQSPLTMWP